MDDPGARRRPLLSWLPALGFALSALTYFLASEGIRNHLLLLKKSFVLLAKHLS